MSGKNNGVAKQMQDVAPNAMYIWCNGHLTSLASGDCIKNCVELRDAMDNLFEIIKLVKLSPRREALFEQIRKELGNPSEAGIRFLCTTRWTVKAQACISVIKNYVYLIMAFQVNTYLVMKNQMNKK